MKLSTVLIGSILSSLVLFSVGLSSAEEEKQKNEEDHSHSLFDMAESGGSADELYASKKRSQLSYKQVMEMMSKGSTMIHEGVLRENPMMVSKGSDLIQEHYAPYHKPWAIFAKENQEVFKQMLLAYNPILHKSADAITAAANKGEWQVAADRAADLTYACISCHAAWKHKVVAYPPMPTKSGN